MESCRAFACSTSSTLSEESVAGSCISGGSTGSTVAPVAAATVKSDPLSSVFDAFTYVNRIPERAEKGESASDVSGRILGRLANQEGRILLKLPPGMSRESYLAFKTFFRYEGKAKVGNCAACHTLAEFTDLKSHVVTKGGTAIPTPSLRNLKKRKVDVRKAIQTKIIASNQRRSGKADEIDDTYAKMNINEKDVEGLVAFLHLLNDVSDKQFRQLILNAKLLDTSEDIEASNDPGSGRRRSTSN